MILKYAKNSSFNGAIAIYSRSFLGWLNLSQVIGRPSMQL
ncbi:hypothetical protein PMAG_b0292 [Pseudoalteromonas mariniglutinosa NCIMB 1770]|nr:hypothetical protein [Pseudoalteromonas mariniglutinosa NCIMB 1770]